MPDETAVAPEVEADETPREGRRARLYNRADAVIGGRSAIPRDLYRVRCIKTKLSQSSSGDDMITLSCEIIDPETIMVPDKAGSVYCRSPVYDLAHLR